MHDLAFTWLWLIQESELPIQHCNLWRSLLNALFMATLPHPCPWSCVLPILFIFFIFLSCLSFLSFFYLFYLFYIFYGHSLHPCPWSNVIPIIFFSFSFLHFDAKTRSKQSFSFQKLLSFNLKYKALTCYLIAKTYIWALFALLSSCLPAG